MIFTCSVFPWHFFSPVYNWQVQSTNSHFCLFDFSLASEFRLFLSLANSCAALNGLIWTCEDFIFNFFFRPRGGWQSQSDKSQRGSSNRLGPLPPSGGKQQVSCPPSAAAVSRLRSPVKNLLLAAEMQLSARAGMGGREVGVSQMPRLKGAGVQFIIRVPHDGQSVSQEGNI